MSKTSCSFEIGNKKHIYNRYMFYIGVTPLLIYFRFLGVKNSPYLNLDLTPVMDNISLKSLTIEHS